MQFLAVFAAFFCAYTSFADSPESYDLSVNHSPLTSVNQNDPALADLFNPSTHKSGLCVPTTLTNIVVDQMLYRVPGFPDLQLQPAIGPVDYVQMVRYFVRSCHTDINGGTTVANATNCLRRYYQDSGYPEGWAYVIGNEENTDRESVRFWGGQRNITFPSLRYYLSHQINVLMDVEWESEDAGIIDTSWTQKGGHTFMVTGFDYDYAWGNRQMMLKVVNPENTYAPASAPTDAADHYDEVTLVSDATSDVDFPKGFHFTLSGKGFPTGEVRGYVRNIMISLPDHSVSPFMPLITAENPPH